ncbi:amidophosphoribosyltransferase [bacterium]|jgi:amidophosphoribosyltransferase|nr:amidophosphoribosyltransferase [bacterium]MBT6831797.1 amidophosphoribosyltransferase [bacterium]MBT6996004.1 amidophosphoribosyltransferase [bacterium]MBT7772625.1 amidophosphoribosyltransferase [bacterium]
MCGIIGVSKPAGNAIIETYDGLMMLQHRGQDSAGIVTFDENKFCEQRGAGLVIDIFTQKNIANLTGRFGLGHCRYTTAGNSESLEEAQPFFVNAPFGIFLIHNGNLTNTNELRDRIQNTYRRHLRTDSDTEVLLNVFADKIYQELKAAPKRSDVDTVFAATKKLMKRVTGAYSVISLIDKVGLFAFRDPYGIRPLVFGKKKTTKGTEWIFASEDVAIKTLGYEVVRDVNPGEAILITKDGEMISQQCAEGKLFPCIFEYIYLARPDSMLNEISVYKTRLRMGSSLAKQIKAANLEIDSVMPVPDSGRPIALQISQDLGIKYREGLVKNRYIGRTFIMPGQSQRQKSIRRKLNTIELEFRNRNILLVDDSIVRGNTMKKIIEMCRAAGAKKVYVASGAPPVRNPDVYGVDIPTRSELVAHNLSEKEVCRVIGADALFYQKVEDLVEAARAGNPTVDGFHTGMFDGKYPTPEVTEELLQKVEFEGRGAQTNGKISLPNI